MTGPFSSSLSQDTRQACSAEQAACLLDPRNFTLLEHLMRQPHSASELARILEQPLPQTHYRLRKLERAKVAELSSLEQRAGRAIRRYRVHPDWMIPFALTEAATLQDLLEAQLSPRLHRITELTAQQMLQSRAAWALRLHYTAENNGATLTFEGPGGDRSTPRTPGIGQWGSLSLRPERAAELSQKLQDLMREYDAPDDPKAIPYLQGLFLVPGEW
ncbi:hypothetical protein HNR42_002105 [Deinobacterium chartae]|uniref:HTH arsR-type domain-containing protein n=1 Tax=Deinobacterium chartae TaxID=521158 RepID=A0A841I2N1_9DEIO|nr:helix-turn-helix domain-containing protein [Deinobacterium chartae]MBB6098670.1 hypothetical protein [Deinobacterium chartae]